MKTVKEYAEELGYTEENVKTVTITRFKYMEDNMSFFSDLMPEEGKLYVVKNEFEQALIKESELLQELTELNRRREDVLKDLLDAAVTKLVMLKATTGNEPFKYYVFYEDVNDEIKNLIISDTKRYDKVYGITDKSTNLKTLTAEVEQGDFSSAVLVDMRLI